VVLAQVVWFGWGVFNPVVAMLVVPLLHSIQYLALTTWHHARGQTGPWLRVLGTYAVTLGLIGWFIQDRPGTWLAGAGVDPLLAAGTVATFVNLHHFLLDGRIWRMRERRVRESFLQSTPAVPSDLSQAA
jgi:hypothetical protein